MSDSELDRLTGRLDRASGRSGPGLWVEVSHEPVVGRRRRVPRRRVRAVVVGLVLVLVLAGAGAVVAGLVLRDRNAEPALPGGSAPAASAAPSSATLVLPTAWRASCRIAPGLDPTAVVAYVCAPGGGIDRVELRGFGTSAARDARFAQLAGDVAAGTGAPRCATGTAETRSWSRPDAPSVVAGRYACRVAGAAAELVWSDDRARLVARAVRHDGDLAALWRWWVTDAPGATRT